MNWIDWICNLQMINSEEELLTLEAFLITLDALAKSNFNELNYENICKHINTLINEYRLRIGNITAG